jgi:DNA-binding CsgD family transcriptional regulator
MLKQETGRPVTALRDISATSGLVANGKPVLDLLDGERVPSAVCMGLTARQRDVLAVMMQGKSNKAICRVLNLAEPTVKNHVTAILKALKVSNRTEAVIKVAKASVASMAYRYTISGQSTFLAQIGEAGHAWLDPLSLDLAPAPALSHGRFGGVVCTDVRVRNFP